MATAMVTIDAPAPLPTALGTSSASAATMGTVQVPQRTMCSDRATASYADIDVTLDESASPWADLLVWRTTVDGFGYRPIGSSSRNGFGSFNPSGSWVGSGRDRVYTSCGALPEGASSEGVTQGHHEVTLSAHIPGFDATYETETVRIDLACIAHQPECPASYDPTYDSECPRSRYDGDGLITDPSMASGCSVGSHVPAPTMPLGFIVAIGALTLLRRRQNR